MIHQISSSEFLSLVANTKLISEVMLPPKIKLPRFIQEIFFEKVDFNNPILGGFLNKPVIQKCKFVNCNLDGINADKSLFEDCIFEKVVFGSKFVGRVDNSKFINSSFTDCQFANTKFVSDSFENCNFVNCKCTKINFNNCDLKHVTFSGVFKTVNWIKCDTIDVDVSSVKMKDVSLFNSDLYDIKLPNNKDNFIVHVKDFQCAEKDLKVKLSERAFEDFCYIEKFIAQHFQYGNIIDKDIFAKASNVEKNIIMETLFSCSNHL